MARRGRNELSEYRVFHICVRGNNGVNIFVNDSDRERFLKVLEKYRSKFSLSIFSFCLMTNHVHILVEVSTSSVLSKFMHAVLVSYAMYFNLKYDHRGHLFQERFSSWVIVDMDHFNATKKYIEENPIRANLIGPDEFYRWRSVGDNAQILPYAYNIGVDVGVKRNKT